MKSINQFSDEPAGTPISSDDIIEFHATRLLLLLLYICGKKDRSTNFRKIEGFTKLVKLDFFVRYPIYFERVAKILGKSVTPEIMTIESKMIRFNYGPWDHRYYQVLPYLESRGLLVIEKARNNSQYNFYLTPKGIELSKMISEKVEFNKLTSHITSVEKILNDMKGNQLKELIYNTFKDEVANKELGDYIE